MAEPQADLEELRAGVSRLAADLYRLETEPELKALSDVKGLTGRSAALASYASDKLMFLWGKYSELTNLVEQLGDGHGVAPDTWLVARNLTASLEEQAKEVLAAAERLAAARRTVAPVLDAAAERLARVTSKAAGFGIGGERSVAEARRLVERAAAVAAGDPLAANLRAAEEAVARAEHRIDQLVGEQAMLSDRLAAAGRLVDELDEAAARGRAALAAAREKVLRPAGLLEPIDPQAYEAGHQGLRAWLGRLRDLAEKGAWQPASEGLARWEDVGRGWLTNAQAVVAANEAPLARRDELRGLLDAYAAKAGATGQAEDPALADLFEAAHDALHTAPCDLDVAAGLVARYADAVRSGGAPKKAMG